jgi:hypothetical protein
MYLFLIQVQLLRCLSSELTRSDVACYGWWCSSQQASSWQGFQP